MPNSRHLLKVNLEKVLSVGPSGNPANFRYTRKTLLMCINAETVIRFDCYVYKIRLFASNLYLLRKIGQTKNFWENNKSNLIFVLLCFKGLSKVNWTQQVGVAAAAAIARQNGTILYKFNGFYEAFKNTTFIYYMSLLLKLLLTFDLTFGHL